MNPRELKRIQEIVRLNKLLRSLKQVREMRLHQESRQEVDEWMKLHSDELRKLSREQLGLLREEAGYDEAAWQEILKQLRE